MKRLKIFKDKRNFTRVKDALKQLDSKIKKESNLLPPIIDCIKAKCTLGEITSILKNHFGEHQ